MNKSLRILHLEDMPTDAELVERALKKGEINCEKIVVDNKGDFIKNLAEFQPTIILSDHSLPSFNSLEALAILRERGIKLPFILITATISEEFAVDVMKAGADDYILKDRLQRLPQAIRNVLEKFYFEREREKYLNEVIDSEALLKETERLAHIGSFSSDLKNGIDKWSEEMHHIFGYEIGEVQPSFENFLKRVHPEDQLALKKEIENAIATANSLASNYRLMMPDGTVKYISSQLVVEQDGNGISVMLKGFNQDITKLKLAEIEREKITADLIQRNNDLEQFTYIVSHNLRAPVANIIGLTNLSNSFTLEEKERKALMEGLNTSTRKLDDVIMDLNNILKVRHEVNEKREQVSISQILFDIRQSIEDLIKKEDVHFNVNFSAADKLYTLKSYIYSILYNLVTNSIKYRRPDVLPVINITTEICDDKIVLTFKDNGLGIDMEKNRSQVFGLYKRFHSHTEGKGMGLYLVKTQVEALGGRISLNSEPDKGTEFKIEFEKAM